MKEEGAVELQREIEVRTGDIGTSAGGAGRRHVVRLVEGEIAAQLLRDVVIIIDDK